MCFKLAEDISTQNGRPLKLANKFTYLGSNISSTKNDVNIHLAKAKTAIDRFSIIWKSDLPDEMKWDSFRAGTVSILHHIYVNTHIHMHTPHTHKNMHKFIHTYE